LPDQWHQVLSKGEIKLPLNTRAVPFTVAPDASRAFVGYNSAQWSGVASVDRLSGAVTRIWPFSNPATDQAGAGAFDGRWLVWLDMHSPEDWNVWDIWASDTSSSEKIHVAGAPTLGDKSVPGPMVQPIVSNGVAAWVQANRDGLGEIHLYSLATRSDQVIETGKVGPPLVFWRSNLIWQVIDQPGIAGHVAMYDLSARQQVARMPAPLNAIHQMSYLSATDAQIAWSDSHSIWISEVGGVPRLAYRAADGDSVNFMSLAGNLISWDALRGPIALDTRSGSFGNLTSNFGGRFAKGNGMVVYQPSTASKSTTPTLSIQIVDIRSLDPLPTCRN
jgi:hypothetical protein